MRGLFVTATDTGVGKTEIATLLLRGHRARGLDLGAMKPAQSGEEPGVPSDADRLLAAAGGADPLDLVCPYRFATPLAPAVAARLEGREILLGHVLACAAELARRHAALLVEGAGGLMTPLTERHTYADLAAALGLPVLVVARPGLGTVNHTVLTCEALRIRGLHVKGVVLCRSARGSDPSEPHNAGEIERLASVPVVASIDHLESDLDRERAATELAAKVQF